MKSFTITADYCATGEGRTMMIMLCMAVDSASALEQFTKIFGEYYALGADIEEGFNLTSDIANALISETCKEILKSIAMLKYHTLIHYNFS